jgi:hypothetical protein
VLKPSTQQPPTQDHESTRSMKVVLRAPQDSSQQ